MNIYIIRHGETPANVERRVQGWLDIPLNDNGIDLAKKTGFALKDIKFDAVFSSPLIRAYQTAEFFLMGNLNPVPEIIKDGRLKEMNFGDWEGQLRDVGSVAEGTFLLDPAKMEVMPNGESFTNLFARTQAFLSELIEGDKYENVLVSTHGCSLRAMLNPFYENKDNYWQDAIPPNCSISLVKSHCGNATLEYSDKVFY